MSSRFFEKYGPEPARIDHECHVQKNSCESIARPECDRLIGYIALMQGADCHANCQNDKKQHPKHWGFFLGLREMGHKKRCGC